MSELSYAIHVQACYQVQFGNRDWSGTLPQAVIDLMRSSFLAGFQYGAAYALRGPVQ